jgi:hypothetical protein
MEIYYSGTEAEIKKQKKCNHIWHGPYTDCIGGYYKCECGCSKRIDHKEAAKVKKKEDLQNVCGAYVTHVNLNFDFMHGGGVVTLCFERPQRFAHPDYRSKPEYTELSFPFETLTVRPKE